MHLKKLFITGILLGLVIAVLFLSIRLYIIEHINPPIVIEKDVQIAKALDKEATVISIIPKYIAEQVPYQACTNQVQTQTIKKEKTGTTGGIIGGVSGAVAGAVTGQQVAGGGVGAVIGGIVGVIGGAAAGSQIEKGYSKEEYDSNQGSTITTCTTQYRSINKRIGYDVTYEYDGHQRTIFREYKPKSRRISIEAL